MPGRPNLSPFTYSLLSFFSAALITISMPSCAYADSLQDLYELALKHDPKLKAAAASYRATLETEKQARARLLPQLNADGSYSRNHRELDTHELNTTSAGIINTKQNRDSKLHTEAWGVSLSQTLFDLPTWFSFKSGKALSEQAEAQFAADQQELIVRVSEAYFNALREIENVSASKEEESANHEQWQQSQARFKSGLVGIADVAQARAEYEISRAKRLTDESHLIAAYEALTAITAQTYHNLNLLKDEFAVSNPEPTDRAEWVQFALQNNYTLKSAISAMESARQNSTAKTSEHLPKITGSLSYQQEDVRGSQELDPPSPFTLPPGSDTRTKMATIKMTMPLYSGGYTSSQSRQANEQYNEAVEKKIEIERTIIQNTRSRHVAATTDVQRVQAQLIATKAAASAVDATRAGYKSGTKSIVDVLQTQRTLFAAMRDHANARYDYIIGMIKLKQLAGTLSPQDVYELNKWLAPNP